ncbi:hypothetical protein [uncultured Amnibacterium sp.]|uniref:hypothetical protein n=1 Tax=uncultured Amnibacterium sp. TaxID=1631851 RepID=UPI0035CA8A61
MQISGHVTEDTPDPHDHVRERVGSLGIAAAGLVPQRHLEDRGVEGISESRHQDADGPEVLEEVTLSRSYVLWRDPDDRSSPRNLAQLDDALRAALDRPQERPLPKWLLDARERLRYPHLWEAVHTSWTAPGTDPQTVEDRVAGHAENVLLNRFRRELGLGDDDLMAEVVVPRNALQPHEVVVDGVPRPGLLLDTDPFVLAVGVALDDGRVVTVVVPRDELPLVRLELASDLPLG